MREIQSSDFNDMWRQLCELRGKPADKYLEAGAVLWLRLYDVDKVVLGRAMEHLLRVSRSPSQLPSEDDIRLVCRETEQADSRGEAERDISAKRRKVHQGCHRCLSGLVRWYTGQVSRTGYRYQTCAPCGFCNQHAPGPHFVQLADQIFCVSYRGPGDTWRIDLSKRRLRPELEPRSTSAALEASHKEGDIPVPQEYLRRLGERAVREPQDAGGEK